MWSCTAVGNPTRRRLRGRYHARVTQPVLSGAEPYSERGGTEGVLVLHGFTGSPQSMRPIAHSLAARGYSVELPLWPGHGTAVEDMVPTRWPDWSEAAERAYEDLASRCSSVALVGLSMGGTLACFLAENHPEVTGLALVNPLVEPPADSFRDILKGLLDEGMEVAPGIGSDIAEPGKKEISYEGSPIRAALSLFEGVDDVAAKLDRLTAPILLLTSREDHVVPTTSGDFLQERVSAKVERVWLERSYHVATLDYDAQEIVERVSDFVDTLFSPGRADGS